MNFFASKFRPIGGSFQPIVQLVEHSVAAQEAEHPLGDSEARVADQIGQFADEILLHDVLVGGHQLVPIWTLE
jgi:hypothetical protein